MTWRSEVFYSRIIHFLAQDIPAEELKSWNSTVILFHVFILLILAGNWRPLKYLSFSSMCFLWMWYFSWFSSYTELLKRYLLYIFPQVVPLSLTNVNFFLLALNFTTITFLCFSVFLFLVLFEWWSLGPESQDGICIFRVSYNTVALVGSKDDHGLLEA